MCDYDPIHDELNENKTNMIFLIVYLLIFLGVFVIFSFI